MLKVYLETSVLSALERRDQTDMEMTALDSLLLSAERGTLALVTSRESIREIERTPVETTKMALKTIYARVEELKDDHVLLGISNYADRWTSFSAPLISDVTDPVVFAKLGKIGLTGSDQKHLMYAIHNKCDVFLTFDRRDFIERGRRPQIEASFLSIKVNTPEELRIEIINQGGLSDGTTR
jgi:predicted nucleic acid-binding protein